MPEASLNRHQRERFLKDHGFVVDHHGKGSHDVWVHSELKQYVESGKKLSDPAALMRKSPQVVWQVVLPSAPAAGTWCAIEKQAVWCSEKAAELKNSANKADCRADLVRQFKEMMHDFCEWKHEVKNRLKVGLCPSQKPENVDYEKIVAIKSKLGFGS